MYSSYITKLFYSNHAQMLEIYYTVSKPPLQKPQGNTFVFQSTFSFIVKFNGHGVPSI